MKRGGKIMKYLEIKNGKGYFINDSKNQVEIDQIKKEDILSLLNKATSEEDVFEMDMIDEHQLENQAHKIIYENLSRKFSEILENKSRFVDESGELYKEAKQKYRKEEK